MEIMKVPGNILEVGTKDGQLFRFDNVLKHNIKFNNDSKCYEVYFKYFDECNMKSVYTTLVIPLNDLEVITCTSLHGTEVKL